MPNVQCNACLGVYYRTTQAYFDDLHTPRKGNMLEMIEYYQTPPYKWISNFTHSSETPAVLLDCPRCGAPLCDQKGQFFKMQDDNGDVWKPPPPPSMPELVYMRIVEYLRDNPEATVREVWGNIESHYSTPSSIRKMYRDAKKELNIGEVEPK